MNSFIVILKNKNLSSFMLVSPKEPNLYFTVGKRGKKISIYSTIDFRIPR